MRNKVKYELIDIGARLVAVLPPLISTLCYFPEWINKSSKATFSGMLLISFFVCMIPMWKKITGLFKTLTSTSMPVFWLIIFGVFFVVKDIIERVIYISLFGLIGSLISMGLCIWRNKYADEETAKKEVNNG